MFRSRSLILWIFWITLAFCVTAGSCTDFYKKAGEEVKMDCGEDKNKPDVEWKLNNVLVLGKSKTGLPRKGNSDTALRARIEGTSLKITQLKFSDSGVYTCKSSKHKLYVVSAHANPSSVLYSSDTSLKCDAGGEFKGTFQWLTPSSRPHEKGKNVTVKSVTTDSAGTWTCQIKSETGKEVIKLAVDISVVGPLHTTGEVRTSEGGAVDLPCLLPAPSSLPIIGGSWTRDSASNINIAELIRIQTSLRWNSTDVNKCKVCFSVQELKANFTVTLKKVTLADAGVYVCSLVFEGGKTLSAKLNLTVLKRDDKDSDVSTVSETNWNKTFWGVQLWIWVVLAVLIPVVITLVVTVTCVCCRNKRMKKKMKKLQSMKQPLTSRNYCKCDRTGRQPGTGKRERPPPLPRHQYSSLNK